MTRQLVHRLMAILPHMKQECEPPLKTRKATACEANDRGKELHRRSRVSKAPPGSVQHLCARHLTFTCFYSSVPWRGHCYALASQAVSVCDNVRTSCAKTCTRSFSMFVPSISCFDQLLRHRKTESANLYGQAATGCGLSAAIHVGCPLRRHMRWGGAIFLNRDKPHHCGRRWR